MDVDRTICYYHIPDGVYTLSQQLQQVESTYLSRHSTEPPAWVFSDSPGLAALVAETFSTPEHTVEVLESDPDGTNNDG